MHKVGFSVNSEVPTKKREVQDSPNNQLDFSLSVNVFSQRGYWKYSGRDWKFYSNSNKKVEHFETELIHMQFPRTP